MKIKPFAVEEWMNEYEVGAKYNIAETCVDSVSLDELFELTGEDKEAFLREFCARRLTYGDIYSRPDFLDGICGLYKTVKPENIITTHGAAGANHHVFCSLVSEGDRVISIMPTYQQLYSIPESIGADLAVMHLKQENGYLGDLDELRALVTPDTKMICINNPSFWRRSSGLPTAWTHTSSATRSTATSRRRMSGANPSPTCTKRAFPSAACPRCSRLPVCVSAGSPRMTRPRLPPSAPTGTMTS